VDEPEYWAYNDVHVDKDKFAHVLVHHEAWGIPAQREPGASPYNVELVRAYVRHALERHAAGQWCVRFGRGNQSPSIWPCVKKRTA
jgi:hypothetical protein